MLTYKKTWGFCAPHNLLSSPKFKEPFQVYIDSDLNEKGELIYAESLHKGTLKDEILISTYCCHPSLGNDNLSGLVTAVLLFNYIKKKKTKYTYRLAIVPETIGAIAFLSKLKNPENIQAGAVITTTAGKGDFGFKESYLGNHWVDQISDYILNDNLPNYIRYPFTPDGSDERQYSSPKFRIPTITISKSKYYEYDEYHTSADNLDYISVDNLQSSLDLYIKWFEQIEKYCKPNRKMKACEYQLGKRNLYPSFGGTINQTTHEENKDGPKKRGYILSSEITGEHLQGFNWLMHLADGTNSNLDISNKSKIKLDIINECIELFKKEKLIEV